MSTLPDTTAPTLPQQAAEILARAAEGYATGQIAWGVEFYRDPATDCRCTLGGIAWAADPDNADGDPNTLARSVRLAAQIAAGYLAGYLVDEFAAPRAGDYDAYGDFHTDAMETVASWNDRQTDVALVVAALQGAAARAVAR